MRLLPFLSSGVSLIFFVLSRRSALHLLTEIVRNWLAPETRRKIEIKSTDYKEYLLQDIEAENLPSFLGGTCTCSHAKGGCGMSSEGPWLHNRNRSRTTPTQKQETINGHATENGGVAPINGHADSGKTEFVEAPQFDSDQLVSKARDDDP